MYRYVVFHISLTINQHRKQAYSCCGRAVAVRSNLLTVAGAVLRAAHEGNLVFSALHLPFLLDFVVITCDRLVVERSLAVWAFEVPTKSQNAETNQEDQDVGKAQCIKIGLITRCTAR